MDHLPLELWHIIFLSLPVKTLAQCSYVCKAWKCFITSPTFTNAHRRCQRRDLMLIKTHPYGRGLRQAYTLYCDGDETLDRYMSLDLPFNPQIRRDCRIIGCCNGVICGIVDNFTKMDEIFLWNPTIRKFLNLPSPELPSLRLYFYSLNWSDLVFGFGFDPKTNDFKVVRIADYVTDCGCHVPKLISLSDIQLYSLKSGGWRNITHLAIDIEYQIPIGSPQALLNGAAHWLGVKRKSFTTVISFHLNDEVFCCYETPATLSFNSQSGSNIRTVAIQGSLSLVEHCENRCIIWVMGEYGDSSSWTKRLDIYLTENLDQIVGLRKNGELLIHMRGRLFSFEHKNSEGKVRDAIHELGLHMKSFLQQGCRLDDVGIFSRDDVSLYNPESALKCIVSRCEKSVPAHCESFMETLALLGTTTLSHVENQFESALRNTTEVHDCNTKMRKVPKLDNK